MVETLLFALGLNFTGLVIAYLFKTDKLTDISYSLTFIGIAIFGIARNDMNNVKWLVVALVFFWATRLGSYLLYRIHVMGRDKRFDEMRNSFIAFGRFWLLQAITAWVVMLPVSYLLRIDSSIVESPVGLLYFGLALGLFGTLFEGVADLQKFAFIRNKSNKGKWIESGLWRISRHPNYFGEILMWLGVYIACYSYLPDREVFIGMTSPLIIIILLLFVSGIPLLEKAADKRWGKDTNYQDYKKRTSILIPFMLRK